MLNKGLLTNDYLVCSTVASFLKSSFNTFLKRIVVSNENKSSQSFTYLYEGTLLLRRFEYSEALGKRASQKSEYFNTPKFSESYFFINKSISLY